MSTQCRWMLWRPQSHQGRAQLATPAPPRPDCGAMLFALGFFSSLFPAWRDGKEERGGSSPVPSQHARHGSGSTGSPMQLWTLVHFWGIKAPALCMGVEEAALSSMVLSACFSWIQNISQASSPMCLPLMGAADSSGQIHPIPALCFSSTPNAYPRDLRQGSATPRPSQTSLFLPSISVSTPNTPAGLWFVEAIPLRALFRQARTSLSKRSSWHLEHPQHPPSPLPPQRGDPSPALAPEVDLLGPSLTELLF